MTSGETPGPSSAISMTTSLARPAGRDLDALARKIDGVLDEIAEAVDDAGPALANGFGKRPQPQ